MVVQKHLHDALLYPYHIARRGLVLPFGIAVVIGLQQRIGKVGLKYTAAEYSKVKRPFIHHSKIKQRSKITKKNMTLNEFNRLLAQKKKELDHLMRRTLPVKVGAMANAHYQDNIRQRQGFLNNGLKEWPKTRRQQSGSKSAAANYGALLSSRMHLYRSIKYVPSAYRVKVSNDLIYAPLHNWGGTVSPTVTPKMRRFAWAKHYKEAGKDKKKDTMWKRLALTKKTKLNIRIPQRQFLGESKELTEQIRQKMDSEIHNILNK
jgi:phage gpG-like protein